MSGGERGKNPAAIAFVNPWKEILAQPGDQNSDTLFLTHYHTIQHIDSRLNLLPDDNILDWSKLKQVADDILQCI